MAIPRECKRLAEVDFPLSAVTKYSSIEKTKKTGTIASIHIWWARRPLSACRAMNLACLLPDPADVNCPMESRRAIAKAIDKFEREPSKFQSILKIDKKTWSSDEDGKLSAARNQPEQLRKRLLRFIGEYSNWDVRKDKRWNDCARGMINGCYVDNPPILLDPFAGGGSIPLESMRIGAKTIATDLNPIPVLINKFQLQFLPIRNETFSEDIWNEANRINDELHKELKNFYPIPQEFEGKEVPIGYICARTIQCEGVGCGLTVPLLTSPWVVNNKDNKEWICYNFKRGKNEVEVELIRNPKAEQVPEKTIDGGNAKCPICGHVTPVESVRRQLMSRDGGSNDAKLLVVIGTRLKGSGRTYRIPTPEEIAARKLALDLFLKIKNKKIDGLSLSPDESLPPNGTIGFNVQGYGLDEWGKLYSPRQALTQIYLCEKVRAFEDKAIKIGLALNVSKLSELNSTLCGWRSNVEYFRDVFSMQTIRMNWDFFEINPFNTIGGVNWLRRLKGVEEGIDAAELGASAGESLVEMADATQHPLPDNTVDVFATDPPYYDKVPYSNLSNYFIVWLNRMIDIQGLENGLAIRSNEVIKDNKDLDANGNHKTADWYEMMMRKAMKEGKRITKDDGIGYVVFADKTTEGWAAALHSLVDGGWTITGSWPIQSEMASRLRAQRSAALKTSVHIVIRPRKENAGIGNWADILSELPRRIENWLIRLNKEGIVGADAIFSCLGPAMELFSKWDSVEQADGTPVTLEKYLEIVWDTVANEAMKILDPTSSNKAVEGDARFSIMVLWALRQSQSVDEYVEENSSEENIQKIELKPISSKIPFDTASLLARGIGANLDKLVDQSVIKMEKDGSEKVVSLLSPADRRHYLLGKTNDQPTLDISVDKAVQLRIGEDIKSAKLRQRIEKIQETIIEIPKRESMLDVLHQAMLLHSDGNTVALDRLIKDIIKNDETTWQLAHTLLSLYPEGSWERSKIEAVLYRYHSISRNG